MLINNILLLCFIPLLGSSDKQDFTNLLGRERRISNPCPSTEKDQILGIDRSRDRPENILLLAYITGAAQSITSSCKDTDYNRAGSMISGALTYVVNMINTLRDRFSVVERQRLGLPEPPLPPGYKLDFCYLETHGNESGSIRSVTSFVEHVNVTAFIGPQETCGVEAAIAMTYNLPMISYYCDDVCLRNKLPEKPLPVFFRTRPQPYDIATAVLSLLEHFEWRKVAFLWTECKEYAFTVEVIRKMLTRYGIELLYTKPVPYPQLYGLSSNFLRSVVQESYEKARIYLVVGDGHDSMSLIDTLHEAGLLITGDYFVIGIDKRTHDTSGHEIWSELGISETSRHLFEDSMDLSTSCILSDPVCYRSYMQLTHTPTLEEKCAQLQEYNACYLRKTPFNITLSSGSFTMRPEAGYLVDAVWLYATAAGEILRAGGTVEEVRNGDRIAERLINRRYMSSLGYMNEINQRGDAQGNYTVVMGVPTANDTSDGLKPGCIYITVGGRSREWYAKNTPLLPEECRSYPSAKKAPQPQKASTPPKRVIFKPIGTFYPSETRNAVDRLERRRRSANDQDTTVGIPPKEKPSVAYEFDERMNEYSFQVFPGYSIDWIAGHPPLAEPECGFSGEKCIKEMNKVLEIVPILICVIVVGLLIGALFVYRNHRFEQELERLLWKVDYRDILIRKRSFRREHYTYYKTAHDSSGDHPPLMQPDNSPSSETTNPILISAAQRREERHCSVIPSSKLTLDSTDPGLNKSFQNSTCSLSSDASDLNDKPSIRDASWEHSTDPLIEPFRQRKPRRDFRSFFSRDTTLRRLNAFSSGLTTDVVSQGPLRSPPLPRQPTGVNTFPRHQQSTFIGQYRKQVVAVHRIAIRSPNLTRELKKSLKILRDISHKNLCNFIGACVDVDRVCVLWDYASRGSLQDIFRRDRPRLKPMFLSSLTLDLIRGLTYLHDSDLRYHGDLKSSNCVVDSRWVLKLTDFGLNSFRVGENFAHLSVDAYFKRLYWTPPEVLRRMLALPLHCHTTASTNPQLATLANQLMLQGITFTLKSGDDDLEPLNLPPRPFHSLELDHVSFKEHENGVECTSCDLLYNPTIKTTHPTHKTSTIMIHPEGASFVVDQFPQGHIIHGTEINQSRWQKLFDHKKQTKYGGLFNINLQPCSNVSRPQTLNYTRSKTLSEESDIPVSPTTSKDHPSKSFSHTRPSLDRRWRFLPRHATSTIHLPEVRDPIEAMQRADIYALGMVLFELYAQQELYTWNKHKPQEIIRRTVVLNDQFKIPYRPNLSMLSHEEKYLTDCIECCWSENPWERPSIKQVASRLRQMSSGRHSNIMDHLMGLMEDYAQELEKLVSARSMELMDEKRRTEQLLYQMLPEPVAEQLKRGKTVEPEAFDSVTIYFSDICGFTEWSSTSSPFEVVNLLNELYTRFDAVLSFYDVYKVETIGDAYMVVSGLPNRNENHAGEIASMSLRLLQEIKDNFTLALRIGIHSGPCAAGVVGTRMPRYCLFGDTVNTASRMESYGTSWRIHCSEECKAELDRLGSYVLEERGLIAIKGKGVVKTYWLLHKTKPSVVKPITKSPTYPLFGPAFNDDFEDEGGDQLISLPIASHAQFVQSNNCQPVNCKFENTLHNSADRRKSKHNIQNWFTRKFNVAHKETADRAEMFPVSDSLQLEEMMKNDIPADQQNTDDDFHSYAVEWKYQHTPLTSRFEGLRITSEEDSK